MKAYKAEDRTDVLGVDGKTLGDRVKEVRRAFDLDQIAFAKSLKIENIKDSMVAVALEKGHMNRNGERWLYDNGKWSGVSEKDALEVILRINEVYNVSIVWLLRGRGAMFGLDDAMVYAQKERILAVMVEHDKKVGELVNLL